MSWSVNVIGKPENIISFLEGYSTSLTGQSKEEFDEAMPSIKGLVAMNFNRNGSQPTLQLEANGHAVLSDTGYGTCNVRIASIGTTLV